MTKIKSVCFSANWNHNLKSQESVKRPVWDAFSTPLRALCARNVLPAAYHSSETKDSVEKNWKKIWVGKGSKGKKLRKGFQPIALNIKTPDGARIKGVFYKSQKTTSTDIPTILYCQPNLGLSKAKCHQWMLKKAAKTDVPYNVVLFDYRGCGKSKLSSKSSHLNAKKLVIDADSVYQCVRKKLGIAAKNVRFYGWSLGGAVSAQVAALHPRSGAHVHSRSFSSLKGVVQAYFPRVLARVVNKIFQAFHWVFDTFKVWKKIKDRSLVVYHPKDRVIPQSASLASKVGRKHKLQLRLKKKSKNNSGRINHHGMPYRAYTSKKGMGARKQILNFLLEQPAFSSAKTKK